jgi:hypothetical protein
MFDSGCGRRILAAQADVDAIDRGSLSKRNAARLRWSVAGSTQCPKVDSGEIAPFRPRMFEFADTRSGAEAVRCCHGHVLPRADRRRRRWCNFFPCLACAATPPVYSPASMSSHASVPKVSGRETMHKKGMEGVDLARKVLESTTWIELPFDASDNERICTLDLLDGTDKSFDAMGYILREPKAPLYVEAKNFDSSGGTQNTEYQKFLANAYSITAKDLQSGTDGKREFMWFTKHPFNLNKWTQLISVGEISGALGLHSNVLGGAQPDPDIMKLVSDRLWLIVVHHKQSELTLTFDELGRVEALLNRKRR